MAAKSTIKKLADQRGIKYAWLAQRIGIYPWTFTRIEAGEAEPPEGYYERIANVLGVPIEWVQPAVPA